MKAEERIAYLEEENKTLREQVSQRLGGKLHWLHVYSTRFLTHLACHPKHGHQTLEAIGIWPRFRGRAMRDRWVKTLRRDLT